MRISVRRFLCSSSSQALLFSVFLLTINKHKESTQHSSLNFTEILTLHPSPRHGGCFLPIDGIGLNDWMVSTVSRSCSDIYRRLFRITNLAQLDSITVRLVKTLVLFAHNLPPTTTDFFNPVKEKTEIYIILIHGLFMMIINKVGSPHPHNRC